MHIPSSLPSCLKSFLHLSFVPTSQCPPFAHEKIKCPLEIQQAEDGMQDDRDRVPRAEDDARLLPLRMPKRPNHHQNAWINVAPNHKPRDVKEYGNQLYPDGEQRNVDHVRFKALLVEHPPRYEEPRVDLNAEASSHEPPQFWKLVW
eukprot:CAMPEP_0172544442 /NCGR_PEP_ID=MMETSP1067-20121228/14607_1 /TAXON_ID=265564 ORGANISM="Thalassiosira punctigera, Strain Tpunct2005C2" /NCGR_SAMPLE_ID=MMETSP1067 /ASSEMBLY_ACC=CAM_ASM_000444 /LENGTH=146 /DNA_ID=CAMNT_0013331007 /DNA_START=98 /DNA_END=535 /DNA_ORIENTATION=+